MKTRLLVSFLMMLNFSCSQTVLHQLTKDKRTKDDIEMIGELKESFKRVNDSLKSDFNCSDTLFIIRGVDIQSRTGYGYVWSTSLMISYIDNKIWDENETVRFNPTIEIKTDHLRWGKFEDMIPLIQKWDTLAIKNYVENCSEVFCGISGWTILRLIKLDSHYIIDLIDVRDFELCNKNKKGYIR